jgi:nucleoside-diphosphate-sugar epimerase
MADRVLVTGVSGVIAGQVALGLLRAGYSVRGSLRSMAKANEVRDTLARAGGDVERLEFVALDLGSDAGWLEAARDCRFVQHIASPFVLRPPKDPALTIGPAVDGTRRALHAGLHAKVERIVLTSSAAAILYGYAPERTEPFTSADWSRTSGSDVTTYSESKTRAELEAWAVMEAAGRRDALVAINPTVVLGPLLGRDIGTSAIAVQRLLNGTVPAAPRIYLNMIDVRDVADLHIKAMTAHEAGGQRFLASAGTMSIYEMGRMLASAYPHYARKVPHFEIPDWIVRTFAFIDRDLGANARLVGVRRMLDTGPTEALLGRPFIPPRLAISATARSLIDYGLV